MFITNLSYGQIISELDSGNKQEVLSDTIILPNKNPNNPSRNATRFTCCQDDDTQINSVDDPGYISFDVNGSEKMVIKNNGDVGIGATSPTATLDIRGAHYVVTPTTTQTQITGGYMTLSKTSYPFIDFSASPYTYYYDARIILQNNDLLYFAGKTGLEFSFNNNVGIGTMNPATRLDVRVSNNDANVDLVTFARTTASPADDDSYNINFKHENDNDEQVNFAQMKLIASDVSDGHEGGALAFYTADNMDGLLDEALRIKENGFVGIGTTNPSAELEVKTQCKIGKELGVGADPGTDGYELYVNGDAWATQGWHEPSDIRFKKNIKIINNALDKVLSLRGTTFEFRTDEFENLNFPKGKKYGFIAQELKEVLPEVVNKGSDGYYAINYSGIIPVLAQAIKEQQKIIKEQSKKISNFEVELNQIKAMLNNSTSNKNPNPLGLK